ncbi:MAG: Eco57I restriction-modification methylase domain-containing protein [Prevotellaceae bacterium]|nr:Eco57I restriction-modification methylase domain-containing protein [Prevotellaceae bacterium]
MLFQKTIVNKYKQALPKENTELPWQNYQQYFLNKDIQQNILQSKEEQFQEGFLRELFVKVLGYTLNPSPDYNLITEKKNETNSKKADGAIQLDGKVIGVIELKDHKTTDLSKVEPQAFNYKSQHPQCWLVVISNFEKLRLYIDNAVEYREWNLFTLTEDEFRELYLCLAWQQVAQGVALQMKGESVSSEDQITKALYRDYSQFKRALFADILKNNPVAEGEDEKEWQLLLFKKTQKLLDRLLFIFFAEDCGLLPPNSMVQIIDQWEQLKEMDEYRPFYDRVKKYFGYMNTGFKGKKYEIFAYNGGLFKPDEVLDNITISDDLLAEHCRKVSEYDFESDVDVNILGHIFENSLSEIEEVTQQIQSASAPLPMGEGQGERLSKRKQDGVFYTPQYITKYIVENTVGRLCAEKKQQFGIVEEEYFSDQRRQMQTKKRLLDQLQQYRDWLLQITILDPACGSGAFLNAALQFLMKEHKLIDEMETKVSGFTLEFQDVENSILENNLYGVDINEESVEIAQLALWLRTAKPHRKLNSLNQNIKCGNSLISDPAVAGEKAFNWQEQFPKVFERGGFDVVIGNPPYVRVQNLDYSTIDYLKSHYATALKRIDISLCFIEKSKDLINGNGVTSFITSNQFLTTEYGQAMRKFLLEKYFLKECVDFGDLPIFEDALTYVSIFILSAKYQPSFDYYKIVDMHTASSGQYGNPQIIEICNLSDNNWNLSRYNQQKIFDKIIEGSIALGEIGHAHAGLFTGLDDVLMFTSDELKLYDFEKELILPVIRAENCNRYFCNETNKYVIYPYKYENGKTLVLSEKELSSSYPNIYKYLLCHKDSLGQRKDSRKLMADRSDWYTLTRFGQKNVFEKKKIVSPGEVKSHKFCIDNSKSGFSCARVFAITLDDAEFDLRYVLCVLNSTLIKTFLQSFASLKSGGYYSYNSNILNRIPLRKITDDAQHPFIALADTMLSLNKQLQEKRSRFLRRLSENFEGVKITTALQTFDQMEFKAFVAELKKQKINLSLAQQDEWEDYFNQYRNDCQQLSEQIAQTDREIDQRVYQLYGLTEEEIKIVEGTN